jgi:signal transduction histidine kinase
LVNKERVGVNELISKAIDDLRVQIEYRESCVDYIPATTAAYLNGDPDSLGKAIVNLLDNALKYSLGRPAVAIAVSTSLDHVDISISDHGIGIPQEYNRSIFEQFFRVPQGNLHDVKGFGLGLSYVKEVIEQHNGKIFVSKNYPTGSRFTIKLPLY